MPAQPTPSPKSCPCHSGKFYSSCCEPYHLGTQLPPSALHLMRSRYSAYALGLAQYILDTTHPKHADQKLPLQQRLEQIRAFSKSVSFKTLDILDTEEGETISFVTFRVGLLQHGKDLSFTEKSEFEKIKGKWLYLRAVEMS